MGNYFLVALIFVLCFFLLKPTIREVLRIRKYKWLKSKAKETGENPVAMIAGYSGYGEIEKPPGNLGGNWHLVDGRDVTSKDIIMLDTPDRMY